MVKVYSKNNCVQCKMVKRYLEENNVNFTEYNIEEEPKYRDYIVSLGYQALPVVETEQTHFSGFRPDLLKLLIEA
ncbi:MAG: glutaredoxin-like protein NrdH [Lactovum sp.]